MLMHLQMVKNYGLKCLLFLAEITLNVEREIYTVVEGNYLEVCVVIANGVVAAFPFHVIGHVFCKL